MSCRHGADDGAQCGAAPAALAFDLEAPAQVGAAGANAEGVWCAAVFGFVNGIAALVDQAGVAPAQPQAHGGAARRDGQQAVVVAEVDVELVGFHAAVVGQLDTDQALLDRVGTAGRPATRGIGLRRWSGSRPRSKWTRIAVEGATTDGRQIERSWIDDMANTYSTNTYGARINCEHIKGYWPGGEFGAYCDVLALKSEEVEIAGVKKLGLHSGNKNTQKPRDGPT